MVILSRIGPDYEQAKIDYSPSNLFSDPDFPADSTSLFYGNNRDQNVIWKRPYDISDQPILITDDQSNCQPIKGRFSNYWLVAAIDTIAQHQHLLNFVVPEDDIGESNYFGMFRFRIWRFGIWYEVSIDDQLPYDKRKQTLLSTTSQSGDFWVPLLEKAYAKILGKYEDLKSLHGGDALEDFTSGLDEMFIMKKNPTLIYHIIRNASAIGSIVLAYKSDRTSHLPTGHVFINDIQGLATSQDKFDVWKVFIKIKMTTPISFDNLDKRIVRRAMDNKAIRSKYQLPRGRNIWIAFGGFMRIFNILEIVNLVRSSTNPIPPLQDRTGQQITEFHNKWSMNANGRRGSRVQFMLPSDARHFFCLDIPDPSAYGIQTIVISVTQERAIGENCECTTYHKIGFYIFGVNMYFPRWKHFRKPAASCPSYAVRTISKRITLPLGAYVVAPYAQEGWRDGSSYFLRILKSNHTLTFGQTVYSFVKINHISQWIVVGLAVGVLSYFIWKIAKS